MASAAALADSVAVGQYSFFNSPLPMSTETGVFRVFSVRQARVDRRIVIYTHRKIRI